jgi:hypothetical protein
MQYRVLSACLLLALACGTPLHADTLKLRKGSKPIAGKTELEGRVLSEAGGVVVFEYKANPSGTIRETVRIPKTDIDEIIREDQSVKAFKVVESLLPTPDLLTPKDYAERIALAEAFIAKHPKSDLAGDAKSIAGKLRAEAEVVEAGGVKLGGKMISATEYKADAYSLDVKTAEGRVRAAIKKQSNLEALRAFAAMDESFPNAPERRELVPEIVKIMRAMRAVIAPLAESYDSRMEKRTAQVDSLPGPEAEAIRREWESAANQLESRYQSEKSANQRWVTPNENHLPSLQDILTQIDSEIARLAQPPQPSTGPEPAAAYRAAWKAIQDKEEPEKIDKAVNDVRAAALPEKYLNLLKEAAAAAGVESTGL